MDISRLTLGIPPGARPLLLVIMASGAVSALLGALWREVQQREQRRTAEDVMSQLRGVVAEAGVWGSILLFALPKRYKARLEEALAESESAQTPHEVLAASFSELRLHIDQ